MKLTVKIEYALLVQVHLARIGGNGLVSEDTITDAQSIPSKYREQTFSTLNQARILLSTMGTGGGYG